MTEPFERTCEPGIVYGRAGDVDLTLDLYRPATEGGPPRPLPIVLYFHGGGWVQGSPGSPSAVAFALEMAAEGLAVACASYRLAPKHPAPAAIEDAKLAVRWIKANALRLGLDPARLVVMGNSAGGHLAMMCALTREEDGFDGHALGGVDSRVFAALDLCGISDVEAIISSDKPSIWAQAWIPAGAPDRLGLARRCSPIAYAARPGAPPTLIVHGDADESVDYAQSTRLRDAMAVAGADVELATIPGAGHMLGISGSVEVQRSVREARRRFFARLGLIKAYKSLSASSSAVRAMNLSSESNRTRTCRGPSRWTCSFPSAIIA